MSCGTADSKNLKDYSVKKVKKLEWFTVGSFRILPFDTQHDSAEPFGFLIEHESFGRLLFATDTYYIGYTFKNLNHILIECNYEKTQLEENMRLGEVERVRAVRLLKSHFELSNVIKFLNSCISGNIKNVLLLHLSGDNASEEIMLDRIKKEAGYDAIVAENGVELNLNICEF